MCLMNNVLYPYLDKFVVVFVDGILVYSRTEEEHENHLTAMLQLLMEHEIYENLSKYDFFQSQIHYLEHIVSKEGIKVDPEKIKAIMEWPTLKNVDEIRSFMGLEIYYKRFLKNYSKIGHPINFLKKKGNKFEWKFECAVSSEQLKQLLTNVIVLRISYPNKYFVVCTYSCKEGLVGVLMQEG